MQANAMLDHPDRYRFSALDPNSVLLLLQATSSRTHFKNIMFKGERIAYEVSMNDIFSFTLPTIRSEAM
jgi:hypothetical protein